ncbi:unnamed protein product [Paramecium sonneborni]|uniref:EGF-like domain-containing protein n=1 Tax=Paramecium sonneborni TaxID=65129 RepID=A0A8S1NYL9_9CILI|nr:unnamed protein product [Paramecium sonneborni]
MICNQSCLTCDSNNSNKCLTCDSAINRKLEGSQCVCDIGYEENLNNLECLPICGDGIVVESEYCDDFNNDPYDGCNQCQLGCQDSCQDCINGFCNQCKENYILEVSLNQCIINCIDYLCSNDSCIDHCVQCEFGNCIKCDELNGWYLNGIKCESKCGDGIVVKEFEECDDQNLNPFDFCNQCQQSCQEYCLFCLKGQCNQCISGFKLISKIIYSQMQCIPICNYNNIIQIGECFDNETNMIIQLKLNCNINCLICTFDVCSQCEVGYKMIDNQCEEISCDALTNQEQEYYNSYQYIQQINQKCYYYNLKCDIGCLSCQEGHCYFCDIGFKLENFQCKEICGDSIIIGTEQCDDNNNIQFDGCYNCLYQCQQECINCQFGKCLECQNGYELIEFVCYEQCGNANKTSNELCDDGNIEPFDGCFNCQYSCDEQCEICNQGFCLKCINQGWELHLVNNQCVTICGDQIIVGSEQCDDGNILNYDGCYECQYECQKECINCIEGICYQCISDLILNNNQCEYDSSQYFPEIEDNICGDGILNLQIEECDDGNNSIRDGCYQCFLEQGFLCYYDEILQFQGCARCQDLNCFSCEIQNQSQICLQCATGYFTDQFYECSLCDQTCLECSQNYKNCTVFNYSYSNQLNQTNCNHGISYDFNNYYECISKCGDGHLDIHEECDDNNLKNLDGCNEFCQLEKGYLYNIHNHSLLKEPDIQVEKKQSNNNLFSLLIYQEQELLNLTSLIITIQDFSILDFNYTFIENKDKLDIQFTFLKTIEPFNLIHLSISYLKQFKKRELEETLIKEIIIVPQRQVLVSEEQKNQGEMMASTYQTIFSAQIYLAPLAIIFGGFQLFLAILDIMSWMNNFYFLNVNYPENVRIIFQQAEWGNIINFPTLQLFNKPNDDYYFFAPLKFQEKEIDPLLFNNIQTPLIFASQVLITFIFSVIFIKLVEFIFKKNKKTTPQFVIFSLGEEKKNIEIQNAQKQHTQQEIQIPKFLQSFTRKCYFLKNNFIANLIKSFQLSHLDITLAVMLQITNQQTANNSIVKMNIIAAYGFLILILYIIFISYNISLAHQVKLENQLFCCRYGCFYEDMKTEQSMAMAYSFINLIRKTVFIISTVTLYFQPIFQTQLCFFSCLLNILLLLQINPYKSKKQYILNFVPDFCVLIIVGCTIIFAFQDRYRILKDETIYQIGWIVGINIYLSISLQLIFLLQEVLSSFWEKLKSLIEYLKGKCINNQ